MPLGSHVAEWKALQLELQRLETNAEVDKLADDFYRAQISPRRHSLARGERLDYVQYGLRVTGADVARFRAGLPYTIFALSFANIYVLVMWIRGVYDERAVRAEMQRSLPRVEALTVSLPPPNPEPAEGAGKQRA